MPCVYFGIPVYEADKITGVAAFKCNAEELWELIERESGRAGIGNVVILSDTLTACVWRIPQTESWSLNHGLP